MILVLWDNDVGLFVISRSDIPPVVNWRERGRSLNVDEFNSELFTIVLSVLVDLLFPLKLGFNNI